MAINISQPMYLLEDFATTRVSGEEIQVFFWADIFHQVWKIFFFDFKHIQGIVLYLHGGYDDV